MDSLMKMIILSAVFIVGKKTFVRFSFSPNYRHLEALKLASLHTPTARNLSTDNLLS